MSKTDDSISGGKNKVFSSEKLDELDSPTNVISECKPYNPEEHDDSTNVTSENKVLKIIIQFLVQNANVLLLCIHAFRINTMRKQCHQ